MRIFLSSQQSLKKHNIPAYRFWEIYLKNGIEEAGHEWLEVKEVDWAEGLVYLDKERLKTWRDRAWIQTVNYIKYQHQIKPINLFLSYLFPKQIDPLAIREIQELGIPCINFFCDNVREFKKIPKIFYCFNLHWVPEFKAIKMYQASNLNYIYAPMPVWIPPSLRNYNHSEKYGVSFIGSKDVQRERLFANLIQFNINLELRGKGWLYDEPDELINESQKMWQNLWVKANNQLLDISNEGLIYWLRKLQSRFIPRVTNQLFFPYVREKPGFDEYFKITQQSQITLGVNRYPSFQYPLDRPNTYSRMRDIEAPMLGACYLTEWTEGLDDLYEIGEEIETYSSVEEMAEKIKYLQASPEKRKIMRANAQYKAIKEHSIPNTLTKIISNFQ